MRSRSLLLIGLALGLGAPLGAVAEDHDETLQVVEAPAVDAVTGKRRWLAHIIELPDEIEQVRYVRHTNWDQVLQLPGRPGNAVTAWLPWKDKTLPAGWSSQATAEGQVLEKQRAQMLLPKDVVQEADDQGSRLEVKTTGSVAIKGLNGAAVSRALWIQGHGIYVEVVAVPEVVYATTE